MNIIIIGPAHPLRGGLSSFNERLARQFMQQSHNVTIYTFSLQYPSFLFPGTTQFSEEPPPGDLDIKVEINSVNPLNWLTVGRKIANQKPDIVIVRYWLPFMGPCLGTILRRIKKNGHTKTVCIADNIIPHEKRIGDTAFTRYFVKPVDAFITMSEKVLNDLKLFSRKPARYVVHPLYDNFGTRLEKDVARNHLGISHEKNIILFFGFIRKYKGLDMLFEAIGILKKNHPQFCESSRFLIAGEFYENRKPYDELIDRLGISELLILRTHFIPDSEVKYYMCAADVVVQPYKNATQSGVTPLAYHFEVPMIVTNVGGLPSLVPDGKAGLVTESDPLHLADAILKFYKKGPESFLPGLKEEKKKYDWKNLVNAVIDSAQTGSN